MTDLILIETEALAVAGQAANAAAAASVFADYRARRARETLRRQDVGLSLFSDYLRETVHVSVGVELLAGSPEAWRGVTWGLVDGFAHWLLLGGFAASSVNIHLSTVRTYARLAAQGGAITAEDAAMIAAVRGYSRTEAKRLDEKRRDAQLPTRRGEKKERPVSLGPAQVQALKTQPSDTPQGRRDALLMALLLDHGLRVGELAGLRVEDVDPLTGELRFYRPKVDKVQTHRLTPDALNAARAYIEQDAPQSGLLLRASGKDGRLTHAGMTTRAITKRVRELGGRLGIAGLSAHDCRHAWATRAVRNGTPVDRLQDAGGWASPVMPLRYVEAERVANDGVRL